MIVPHMRLILLAGGVLPAAAFTFAWWSEWSVAAMGTVAVFLAVCIGDVTRSIKHLRTLTVSTPEVVRMTVDKISKIKIVVKRTGDDVAALRLGLALPHPCESEQEDLRTIFEKEEAKKTLLWECRPLQRGTYSIARCHLEIESKLGLWYLRRRVSVNIQIRAYPNLMSGQQHLLGLFRRHEWGVRTQRRIGKGREFEQLRDYLPGDSFEDIDWKATARRRHPITRVYQVEQAQEIYVVLDASRLSTRSAEFIVDRRHTTRSTAAIQASTIFERYITAALVMAVAAEKLSDRYGLLIFGDKPECLIKAGRGRAHYNACRDALYNRMPNTVSPDFDELFTYVGTHLRKRALLVFLTSLDDPLLAESFIHAMGAVSRQHILMVNMFRPPGAHPLFSSSDIKNIQGVYQHLIGHMLWASINETHRRLRQKGAELKLLDGNQLCSQLVNQYMDIKQQQVI